MDNIDSILCRHGNTHRCDHSIATLQITLVWRLRFQPPLPVVWRQGMGRQGGDRLRRNQHKIIGDPRPTIQLQRVLALGCLQPELTDATSLCVVFPKNANRIMC